jgi:hypothetical protein
MLRLLNAVTATTSAPSAATDGQPLQGDQISTTTIGHYWQKRWNNGQIALKGTGTGALTFQGIIWLYFKTPNIWAPAGISATIADRGKLNDGTTITGTTTLVHTQPIYGLSSAERIALQATTLTGTDMTVTAWLIPIVPEG